jgi:steroid delta-isomerase-like uncharacterized protein
MSGGFVTRSRVARHHQEFYDFTIGSEKRRIEKYIAHSFANCANEWGTRHKGKEMKTKILLAVFCVCTLSHIAHTQVQKESATSPKAVLLAYVAAWNRHDYAAFDKLLAPKGIHEDLAEGFHGQGAEQVKSFMRDVLKVEPDFVWNVTNVIESGNTVVAEWTWAATYSGDSPIGRLTGQHVSGRGACVAVIKDGHIQRLTDYYDNASFFPKGAGHQSGDN